MCMRGLREHLAAGSAAAPVSAPGPIMSGGHQPDPPPEEIHEPGRQHVTAPR